MQSNAPLRNYKIIWKVDVVKEIKSNLFFPFHSCPQTHAWLGQFDLSFEAV
jgi:hypothetical protein